MPQCFIIRKQCVHTQHSLPPSRQPRSQVEEYEEEERLGSLRHQEFPVASSGRNEGPSHQGTEGGEGGRRGRPNEREIERSCLSSGQTDRCPLAITFSRPTNQRGLLMTGVGWGPLSPINSEGFQVENSITKIFLNRLIELQSGSIHSHLHLTKTSRF